MSDPYNTAIEMDAGEITSEYDANRALAEQALDFDHRLDVPSEDEWQHQDAEMQQEEEKQIEILAEIQELRTGGWL